MASHVLTSNAGSPAESATDRRVSLKQRFLAWCEQRRRRAQVARELLTYTDRELFDLGISRGDIPAIIDGTFRR